MTSLSIITHSGRFHCDEVSAVALLELLFGEKAIIIRTRDLERIEELKTLGDPYIVDVGKIYDPDQRCFDHHQTEMNLTFGELEGLPDRSRNKFRIPVSSLGLVYQIYGRKLIDKKLESRGVDNITPEEKEHLYINLYYDLCRDIDANDNGLSFKSSYAKVNYIPNMSLIALVSAFNSKDHDGPAQDPAFRKAVDFVSVGFSHLLDSKIDLFLAQIDIRANFDTYMIGPEEGFRDIIDTPGDKDSEEIRKKLYSSFEEVLVLREPIEIERMINEIDFKRQWKFIIIKKSENEWKISARKGHGRSNLIDLISEREAKELFDDVKFIHKAKFVGEASSLYTALQICDLSLKKFFEAKEKERQDKIRADRYFEQKREGILKNSWRKQ